MADYDVAVIGGGIAGVTAACFLSASHRVVLLEAEQALAHHTTGRSAAVFLENYGGDVCRALAKASRPFFEATPSEIMDVAIFHPCPLLTIGGKSELDFLYELAADGARFAASIHFVEQQEALGICSALRPELIAGGVYEPDSTGIDVMALHQGFVRGMRANGAEIQRNAGVIGLARVDGMWEVTTTKGDLRASKVVNAAGSWVDEVASMAGVRPIGIMPLRRTAFTSKPQNFDPAWPFIYHADESFYCRPEAGGYLFCSPVDETPSEPCDAKAEEIDVAQAIETINNSMDVGLRSVQTAWAGLRNFVADREHVIGFDDEIPGFFWMAGQGGTGILTAPAAGAIVAELFSSGSLPASITELGVSAAQLSPARLADRTIRYGQSPEVH